MIIYFADRFMNILSLASTDKTEGYLLADDVKTSDIETGVASFECYLYYQPDDQGRLKADAAAGNYILRKNDDEYEFYTIIETENDSQKQRFYLYAEDAGLDLLNEVVGPYSAPSAVPIASYISQFAYDSGFEVGVNEIANRSRKLSWEGTSTAAERIRSVATQFDAELGYSFDIDRLTIRHKYIDIYEKRGKDFGQELRLGREVKRIVEKTSIANLVTALSVTGGTPEGSETPITLRGYTYDDGDIFVTTGGKLQSRSALEVWSRYLAESSGSGTGHIVGRYSYDTTSQSELCSRAVAQLKKQSQPEINYDVELYFLPENLQLGDTVNIVDDSGELYVSARLLKLKERVTEGINEAVFGDFLIKSSGISEQLLALATEVQEIAQTRALYTWIAYADDSDGTGISTDPEGKSYIGFAANRTSAIIDITDPTIFTWSDMAVSGITMTVTSSNGSVFKNTLVTTTLTAHIYMNDEELGSAAIAALGVVKWYSIASGVETEIVSARGALNYTISPSDNVDSANIVAKLETVEATYGSNSE